MSTNSELQTAIDKLNVALAQEGLLKIAVMDPLLLKPQQVNARYFTVEKMRQLTDNVRLSGHLESTPLIYFDDDGEARIISGHHRVDAAKAAGLKLIMVLVAEPGTRDEIVSKQLAHNAIVGLDDKMLLQDLFESITSLSMKMRTGLDSEIQKIGTVSLNFKVGMTREFTVLFLPEDIGLFDDAMEAALELVPIKPSADIRITSMEYWDRFKSVIMRLKKVENIKSNGSALIRLIELAEEKMSEHV